jgi:hypothetical protein
MPQPIARSSRPQSAQRRAPKVKEASVTSSAPTVSDGVAVGIMKEGAADSDEEDHADGDKSVAKPSAVKYARSRLGFPPLLYVSMAVVWVLLAAEVLQAPVNTHVTF